MYVPLLVVGVVLVAYAFVTALAIRGELQVAHHARSAAASALSAFPMLKLETITSAVGDLGSAGSSLPVTTAAAAVLGGLLMLVGGIGALFKLQPIKRAHYAQRTSFDNAVFTGYDFAHFNHRGRAHVREASAGAAQ
jgi:hypothetical protein